MLVDKLPVGAFTLNNLWHILTQYSMFFTLWNPYDGRLLWLFLPQQLLQCNILTPFSAVWGLYKSSGKLYWQISLWRSSLPTWRIQVVNSMAPYMKPFKICKYEGWKWEEKAKGDEVTKVRRLCYWAWCLLFILFELFSFSFLAVCERSVLVEVTPRWTSPSIPLKLHDLCVEWE